MIKPLTEKQIMEEYSKYKEHSKHHGERKAWKNFEEFRKSMHEMNKVVRSLTNKPKLIKHRRISRRVTMRKY